MWLDTKIDLYDQSEVEMGLAPKYTRVRAKLLIDQIIGIRECINTGSDVINPKETYLYFKSGETFIVKEPYDKIAELIEKKDE